MEINKNIKDINNNITQKVKTTLPLQLQYIFGVFFLGVFFMMLYRFAIFTIHCFTTFSDLNPILLIKSLVIGIYFDAIILCWILLPFIILIILGTITNINKRWIYRPLHIILCLVLTVAFFIIATDVIYFSYFNTHINIIVVSWMESPKYIFSLFLQRPVLLLYLSIFLFSICYFLWLMYCLYNATMFKAIPPYKQEVKRGKTVVLSVILLTLCVLGMHSSLTSKNPFNNRFAHFSDSDFFNQLSINSIFNLAKSIDEENYSPSTVLSVIDGSTTKKIIDEELISKNDRPASIPELPERTNIVMIMTEDIALMDITPNKMPYLTNLTTKSLSFTNIYPDGENIYNGVFSTVCGYPNILSSNRMSSTIVAKLNGIATTLKSRNYSSILICDEEQKQNNTTHFLSMQDFSKIYTFSAINASQDITNISKQKHNFFSLILLNTDKSESKYKKIDAYIKDFINSARKTLWFNNTLFIITTSCGKDKIPLIMYMPNRLKEMKNNNLASQTDIAPTLLSMLDKNYFNENTLGLNIFANQRSYALSSYAHSIVVQNDTWKYVWRDSGYESLYYNGSDKDKLNYIKIYPLQAITMKNYGFAFLQYTQYAIAQAKLSEK